MPTVEAFKNHLIDAEIVDPDGVHHEFVGGGHGQKINFDAIPDDSPLLEEWVDHVARFIDQRYPAHQYGKLVVLSVAGGTNRIVEPTAELVGPRAHAAKTKKIDTKTVEVTEVARDLIVALNPDMIVAVEDAGTTGFTASTAAISAQGLAGHPVEVVNTWQRELVLPRLVEAGIGYSSIITEIMPSFEPEVCEREGFCADGWRLIPHD